MDLNMWTKCNASCRYKLSPGQCRAAVSDSSTHPSCGKLKFKCSRQPASVLLKQDPEPRSGTESGTGLLNPKSDLPEECKEECVSMLAAFLDRQGFSQGYIERLLIYIHYQSEEDIRAFKTDKMKNRGN